MLSPHSPSWPQRLALGPLEWVQITDYMLVSSSHITLEHPSPLFLLSQEWLPCPKAQDPLVPFGLRTLDTPPARDRGLGLCDPLS